MRFVRTLAAAMGCAVVATHVIASTAGGQKLQIARCVSTFVSISRSTWANTYFFICNPGSCPLGAAWADKAYAIDSAHQPVECAGAGLCDRVTGTCDCFEGYTGAACQRSKDTTHNIDIDIKMNGMFLYFTDMCPDRCSGHGACMSMKDISIFFGPDYDNTVSNAGDGRGPTYANWDAEAIMMCRCEYGFFGSDCSQLMCPKGDDPLTINQQAYQIKLIVTSDSTNHGTLGVKFQGESIFLNLTSASGADCETAFEANDKFEDVSCSVSQVSQSRIEYNLTVESWPLNPKENNLYAHEGSPSLTEFYCDTTRAGNDVSCEFVAIKTTNVKGMSIATIFF